MARRTGLRETRGYCPAHTLEPHLCALCRVRGEVAISRRYAYKRAVCTGTLTNALVCIGTRAPRSNGPRCFASSACPRFRRSVRSRKSLGTDDEARRKRRTHHGPRHAHAPLVLLRADAAAPTTGTLQGCAVSSRQRSSTRHGDKGRADRPPAAAEAGAGDSVAADRRRPQVRGRGARHRARPRGAGKRRLRSLHRLLCRQWRDPRYDARHPNPNPNLNPNPHPNPVPDLNPNPNPNQVRRAASGR